MNEPRTTSVRRVEFGVDWPPGHVAAYLIDGEEQVLVDAGMAAADQPMAPTLADVGCSIADIDHLVITHPHVDHVGQVPHVIEAADATVHAPAGVRERFGRDAAALGERVRANAAAVGLTGDMLDLAAGMAVESLERDRSLLSPEAVDHWVHDGETFSVGGHEFEAVHTPGHQADHLCYVTALDGEATLFAGDMAIEPFRPVVIHDGLDDGYREAFAAFFGALDRLDALDVDRVYPGHGPVHADLGSVVERHRGSLHRRLDTVVDLLGEGYTTVPDLAVQLSGDRDPRYMVPEMMGTVAHLVETGRARTTQEDGVTYYHPA
jgi:glyoxylase-like metal-dependent hydrolase (beta-lactamase superfamily II)